VQARISLTLCIIWLCAGPALAQPAPAWAQPAAIAQDWQSSVRQHAAAQDFPGALAIVDDRLRLAPDDLEARGWRARILGWTGRWTEAETEYRRVLTAAPKDLDILTGLGRTLRAQGRRDEARQMFGAALAIDPRNAEAQQGLASLREPPRHELTASAGTDQFNFTADDARALDAAVRSKWTPGWTTVGGARFDHRAGLAAARWSGAVTRALPGRAALTAGGAFGRDNGIVAKAEVFADYGRGFTLAPQGFVRGAEVNVQVRRLWFDEADVATIAPGALIYLPREWTVHVVVTAARSAYPGLGAEWRPSSLARVTFPAGGRIFGHVFFAAGTENYALADQIGAFAARTIGGGVRIRLMPTRDLTAYVAYQSREQARTQTSVGVGYALRF
jgi:YaiO family outer membrane protein